MRNIASGQTESVRKILISDKSLLNLRIFDYVPLYYAARSGHYDIVEMILKMGCSLNFKGQKSTPLHCAAYYGHSKIVILLLRCGISTKTKNSFGELPTDGAINEIKQIFSQYEKALIVNTFITNN